jgi:hypothetical protein
MENKQTAVEWLEDRCRPKGYITAEEFQQAKEMEKEQHEETALSILEILLDNLEGKNDLRGNEAFEHIWNKTYGGNI